MREDLGWDEAHAQESTQHMVDDDEISSEEQAFMLGYADEMGEA